MTPQILKISATINNFLWGPYMLGIFLFTGLLFTVGTGFFQFRHIRLCLRYTFFSLFKKEKKEKGSITQLQSLSTALAATVGTGNITGVAIALVTGGPGAIFWMWVSAFLGMMTAYAENVLAILYRKRDKDGIFVGGAMVYIEKGLHSRPLAVLYCLFCILASLGMGNMTQTHSISSALSSTFGIMPFLTGIICALFIFFIIKGGISRITVITEKTMLPMIFLYFLGSLICLIHQKEEILPAIKQIFLYAFQIRPCIGGTFGYGIKQAMRTGISRGVFSNEAGLGSSASIHASSSVKEPVIQGMWGIFEVFIDTIVVCTVTALVILTSGVYLPGETSLQGVALTSAAYGITFGKFGEIFISLSIVFFAFATILGWSCFGEQSISYLFGKRAIPVYRFLFIIAACIGAWSSIDFVWNLSDTFNVLMAIPNLAALLFLSRKVFKETKRFLRGTLL